MTLAPFLNFLENQDLLSFDILREDEEGFNNRLRIQKYVYLANRHFGLDLDYGHSMYRHGPYSSRLAGDYYELAEAPEKYDSEREAPLPPTFALDNFVNVVSGRNENWLEIATTLLEQKRLFANNEDLVNRVEDIKGSYSLEYIQSVLNDLINNNLLS